MNFRNIINRLEDLERQGGIIQLPNGSLMKGTEFIILYYKMLQIEEENNRDPLLSDFDEKDQNYIRGLAEWRPDSREGVLAVFMAEQCQKIAD